MEWDNLPAIILMVVLVGLLLGVGILTLDKFGSATKDSFTETNESVTIASSVGNTLHRDVTSVSFFGNDSNSTDEGTFTIGSEINWTSTGSLLVDGFWADGVYNVSYGYNQNNSASVALDSTVSAIKPIAEDWLPLIITIIVLAIILTMVVTSFMPRR